MNKRHLHHLWRRLRLIKPWYFLIIAILSGIVCLFALRSNNEHMIQLRSDVYAADEKAGDTKLALQRLQQYVTSHMNTNLSSGPAGVYPPVQLKYTYDRLVKAQSDQIAQANTQLYSSAQAYCEQQNATDFSGHNRVPCIEQYVLAHTTQKIQPIPDAQYKFAFLSPTWSPDLAGWSMAMTFLCIVLFVGALLAQQWFKRNIN